MTLVFQSRSRLRCCTGDKAASTTTSSAGSISSAWPNSLALPEPNSVAGTFWRNGTDSARVTSRSIARARPTASASLAEGVRAPVLPGT